MAAERRAQANWKGSLMEGSGTVTLASSGITDELPVTWASRTEEPGGKTSPEELIAGAHAACFSMALSHLLAQQGHAPDSLETSAVCTFDKVGEAFGITRVELEVTGSVPGLDATEFEKAAESAKDGCPVSNALKGNVEIGLRATLA